jgi:hypothetical protein
MSDQRKWTAWRYILLGFALEATFQGVFILTELVTGARGFHSSIALAVIFGPPQAIALVGMLMASLHSVNMGRRVIYGAVALQALLLLGSAPFLLAVSLRSFAGAWCDWLAVRSLRTR